jgi:murein DD-endopeptidase MepM/ murein hydrolase activator NlpD
MSIRRLRRGLSIISLGLVLLGLQACGNAAAGGQVTPTTRLVRPPQVHTPANPPTVVPMATATQQPTITPTSIPAFQICSPLEIHGLAELREITSDPYRPPPPGSDARHQGVDFSYYTRGERTTIQGVGVQSVLPGRVAAALSNTFPFGNLVIIETPNQALPEFVKTSLGISPQQSLYLLYAHMDGAPLVTPGAAVTSCQPIGKVGKSGNAVEPHLHLETRTGPPGATFESMGYYQATNTEEEKANYLLWRTSGTFQHMNPMNLLNLGLGTPAP